MSSRRAAGTWPFCTAVLSFGPKYDQVIPISWSSPAFAAGAVEWVAFQSDITQPLNPSSPFRYANVVGFWHAKTLLMRL